MVRVNDHIPVQRLAAWGMRAAAVLVLLGGLLASAGFWGLLRELSDGAPPPSGTLTALALLQALFLAAVAGWTGLLWRRARGLAGLVTADYPAITCFALCMRLAGELAALLCVLASLGFSVATLAWGEPLAAPLTARLGADPALAGVATAALTGAAALAWPAAGLLLAGLILFGGYLFAEGLTVMLDYARDVRRIRERLEAESAPDGADRMEDGPGAGGTPGRP